MRGFISLKNGASFDLFLVRREASNQHAWLDLPPKIILLFTCSLSKGNIKSALVASSSSCSLSEEAHQIGTCGFTFLHNDVCPLSNAKHQISTLPTRKHPNLMQLSNHLSKRDKEGHKSNLASQKKPRSI